LNTSGGTAQAIFCTCPRGLESALADELAEIGIPDAAAVAGGVHCSGSWADCYRANLHSRLASRILWRVAHGAYRSEEDVYRLALAQSWGDWFDPGQTIRVDVTAAKIQAAQRKFGSSEFLTLRIKDAICDRLRDDTGERPSVDTHRPDVRIFAFLDADACTLYMDTSGEALFKRGWRSAAGEAPLRENLAAGILRLAGWRPGIALLDPMCGSGTFAVEAAQIGLGIAPGANRSFGFEKLKNFDFPVWKEILGGAAKTSSPTLDSLGIFASDVSGDAVAATRANLQRAGVPDEIAMEIAPKQIDARHVKPPASGEPGIVVVNPPYGERVGVRGADLATEFFAEFGNTLKQRFAGWQVYVLTSDLAFQKKLRLAPKKRIPLFNGAIECRLYAFDLVAGSNRRTAVKG
jgi:putative N6-adenine-specific DNA methylase